MPEQIHSVGDAELIFKIVKDFLTGASSGIGKQSRKATEGTRSLITRYFADSNLSPPSLRAT
jgi:hypothetical protein